MKVGPKDADACCKTYVALEEGTASEQIGQKKFKKFVLGFENLEDELRSGRLSMIKHDNIKITIEQNSSRTLKFNISCETIRIHFLQRQKKQIGTIWIEYKRKSKSAKQSVYRWFGATTQNRSLPESGLVMNMGL